MIDKTTKVFIGIAVVVVIALIIILALGFSGSETTGNFGNVPNSNVNTNIVGSNQQSGVIKFGFVGPLTGDVSSIGQQSKAATQLAVEEINAAGGVNGKKLQIIFEDGKCNAKEAASAGSKLINIDGVNYIIGGICSGETLAIAPVAEQSRVLMISPTSSSPDVTNAGDYIFRDYINDNDAGKVLAQRVFNDGYKKVALLWSLSDWGDGLSSVFLGEYENLGGKVVYKDSFVQGTNDLKSIISKIKSSDAEAVVLFEYTTGAITYFKQKQELGLNLRTYGTDTFVDPTISETVGDAFEGTRYVITVNSLSDGFKDRMMEFTGDTDILLGSSQSYDAVYILKNAIEAVGDDTTKVKDWLYGMPTYQGESGSIKFDANGDLKNPKFDLWEYKDGAPVLIS